MTERPPAVPLPGPNVTPEPNEKIKVLAGNSTVPGAKSKPEDTLRIRKTPWHGVTEQPPAVPPEPNEESKVLASNSTVPRHRKRARTHPSNQENTLASRRNSLLPSLCRGQTSLLNRMKKSRFWQAIPLFQGTQTKPQDTLQIRKTPWHGVTEQPPALNRMKKSRVWQAIVPGTQNKPQDTLQIRKTPWHGVTKQPPAVLCPGQTSLLNRIKKVKGLAGNCSRHTKQATRHPSNQENTLARRDETASCHPSARAKRHS